MARLVLLSEGFTGRTYELKVDKTTVGRLDDNTLQIAEPSVSSHHCEIYLKGEEVLVKDLGSTNGTFLNGAKVTETVLKPGQILRLGSVEMRLETGEPGATPAPAPAPAAAAAAPADKSRQMSRGGVKANELESGNKTVRYEKTVFSKKDNKPAKAFIAVGIVLGIIIVAFLAIAFFKMQGE